jgi:hypothetical protein
MDEGTAMSGTTIGGSRRSGGDPRAAGPAAAWAEPGAAAGPAWDNQQAMGTYGDVIRLVVGPHR